MRSPLRHDGDHVGALPTEEHARPDVDVAEEAFLDSLDAGSVEVVDLECTALVVADDHGLTGVGRVDPDGGVVCGITGTQDGLGFDRCGRVPHRLCGDRRWWGRDRQWHQHGRCGNDELCAATHLLQLAAHGDHPFSVRGTRFAIHGQRPPPVTARQEANGLAPSRHRNDVVDIAVAELHVALGMDNGVVHQFRVFDAAPGTRRWRTAYFRRRALRPRRRARPGRPSRPSTPAEPAPRPAAASRRRVRGCRVRGTRWPCGELAGIRA